MLSNYNHKKIEAKWGNKWEKERIYSPDLGISKDTFYNLFMFPYPSAEGLHAGHAFASTGSDVYGRFMRMQARVVFQPIGYDSFGIHSENFALSISEHPQKMIERTTKNYAIQLKSLGHGYDWNRTVTTSDIEYYRWTQWIFMQMFKAGLAYRKKEVVNWCPSCKTVLADEQVIDGKCERCQSIVETKELEQWFFRITDYADKLLEGLTRIDWPEKIKTAQRNWIGKSEGATLKSEIRNPKSEIRFIDVFTTRPDTLFGATFIAVSPNSPLAVKILDSAPLAYKQNVSKYIKEYSFKGGSPQGHRPSRVGDLQGNKSGEFTGVYAINPATKKEIPIWIADYVLAEYGTGAIMGVPAHDGRDFEFAKKYHLDIVPVVAPQREYVDKNARSYFKKRTEIHKKLFKELAEKANKIGKKLMLQGGWAVAAQVGGVFREYDDLDLLIMEEDVDWWREQLQSMGMTISNMFPKDTNLDFYFQATKQDVHIDLVALKIDKDGKVVWLGSEVPDKLPYMFDEMFEKKSFEGEDVWAVTKDVIYKWKYMSINEGKEKRWKDSLDFLVMELEPYEGSGILFNSGDWDGLRWSEDKEKIMGSLEENDWGERKVTYHLRDWLISRQRYWGPPIPMVFCEKCAKEGRSYFSKADVQGVSLTVKLLHEDQSDWGHAGWWPVDEIDLPVELPYMKNHQPKGTGRGPLAASPEFYKVACPECGSEAKRETDVSDTFLDSSWYFLRYPSVGAQSSKLKVKQSLALQAQSLPWDPKITKDWLPVDLYFGGAEHAVLHLMYARFVWKVLYDLGYLKSGDEPFPKFFAHGLMIKDGAKMSKSKGNVINPDTYIEKYGADTLRLYLMFMGPMDGYPDFRDTGIEGMRRFIEKVWLLFQIPNSKLQITNENDAREILVKMHQTIKKVTEDIEKFHYNTAISAIMEFVNLLRDLAPKNAEKYAEKRGKNSLHRTKVRCAEWDGALRVLAQLIAPFAPYMTEELWQSHKMWEVGSGKIDNEVGSGKKNRTSHIKSPTSQFSPRTSIHFSKWPQYDPEFIKEDSVTIAVQVDAKLRATIEVKSQMSNVKSDVIKAAKADPKIKNWLSGNKIKNTIFVPGRLINFVTK